MSGTHGACRVLPGCDANLRTLSDHVGIAGFSFGAGPALLAAAEVPGLRVAGTFGGYADLRRVIAYITTGVHSFGGRRYAQRPEEYNRWKLLALLTGFLENERDRGSTSWEAWHLSCSLVSLEIFPERS